MKRDAPVFELVAGYWFCNEANLGTILSKHIHSATEIPVSSSLYGWYQVHGLLLRFPFSLAAGNNLHRLLDVPVDYFKSNFVKVNI